MKPDGRPQPGQLCLTCGQVVPDKLGRTCGTCVKPILKHHKYWFDGSIVRHRNCEKPTEYEESANKVCSTNPSPIGADKE